MEEKEEGISLGEIIHTIFIKKWLLLAITIVVVLIGVLFVQVVYNPQKEEYHATFQVVFPDKFQNTNNADSYLNKRYYPDGTEFLYQELISLNNLKEAQSKDEQFESINVEKIRGQNGISIAEYEREINQTVVKTGIYTISISKKYFKSADQARDFFEALISLPTEKVLFKSKSLDYDRYLKQYDVVDDYESKLDILIKQKNLIIDEYNRLISTYSTAHSITLANGANQTINEAQSELESYFTNHDLESMMSEVKQNGYIPANSDFLNTIINREAKLIREREENELKLESLTEQINKLGGGQAVVIQDITTTMTTLTERNAMITYMLEHDYDRYTNAYKEEGYSEKLANFEGRINAIYQKLKEFTDVYAAFNYEIYETNTTVIVSAGSVIVQTGGLSIIIVLAASLVIGFVLGCCVNLIIDLPKYLKEKKNGKEEQPKEEMPDPTE